jgi:hypothetical protein
MSRKYSIAKKETEECLTFSISVKTLAGDLHLFCADHSDNIMGLKIALLPLLSEGIRLSQLVLLEMTEMTEMSDTGFLVCENNQPITKSMELNLLVKAFDPWNDIIHHASGY